MATRTTSSQKGSIEKAESFSLIAPVRRLQNTMAVFRVDGFVGIAGLKALTPLIQSPGNTISKQWVLSSTVTGVNGTVVCILDNGITVPPVETTAEFSIQMHFPPAVAAQQTDIVLWAIRASGEGPQQTECISSVSTGGASSRFMKATFKTNSRPGDKFYFMVQGTVAITFGSTVVWVD